MEWHGPMRSMWLTRNSNPLYMYTRRWQGDEQRECRRREGEQKRVRQATEIDTVGEQGAKISKGQVAAGVDEAAFQNLQNRPE